MSHSFTCVMFFIYIFWNAFLLVLHCKISKIATNKQFKKKGFLEWKQCVACKPRLMKKAWLAFKMHPIGYCICWADRTHLTAEDHLLGLQSRLCLHRREGSRSPRYQLSTQGVHTLQLHLYCWTIRPLQVLDRCTPGLSLNTHPWPLSVSPYIMWVKLFI